MKRIAVLALVLACADTELMKCGSPGPFYLKFLAVTHAIIRPGESAEFAGRCFKRINVTLTETETEFKIQTIGQGKNSWYCNEFLIPTTGKQALTIRMMWAYPYENTWLKTNMSEHEIVYVRNRGVRILVSCADTGEWFYSFLYTAKAFIGGLGLNPNIPFFGSKVPDYMLNANLEWLEGSAGHKYERREVDSVLNINKNDIKSGTTLGLYRFDGVDTLIEIGSGSRLGHVAVAVWLEQELYVLESKNNWSWPLHGIQAIRWEDWLIFAHNADNNVIILPLKDEYQAKFDQVKAWAWFETLRSLPYGLSNFIFGWIDTLDKNTPDFLDWHFISVLMTFIELKYPDVVKLVFIEGFNMRLGTSAQSIAEVWEELYRRDLTPEEVLRMVEKEGWKYSTGPNYVCSSLVASVYKMAGLFGDLEIESTELTPKDLYELDIFDLTGDKLPRGCEGHAEKGYCQIMGKVLLDIGKAGFVTPYSHMDEGCPTVAPDYTRTEGC